MVYEIKRGKSYNMMDTTHLFPAISEEESFKSPGKTHKKLEN